MHTCICVCVSLCVHSITGQAAALELKFTVTHTQTADRYWGREGCERRNKNGIKDETVLSSVGGEKLFEDLGPNPIRCGASLLSCFDSCSLTPSPVNRLSRGVNVANA